uniref:CS domain-containing protein n=1 Tax=Corethron hystrix TaxID=216773 RepID=A0A7S1G3Z6_9STRA|mmetsp:Transcript_9913/g.22125  ORF Transcript_9913/g.22125 Transcript_9913/m.22125 type:complete len:349 (+) Transcript_9913:184-1230(+)
MSFRYVFIPCDPSISLEERTGDGSGGLASDKLLVEIKSYFASLSGPKGSPTPPSAASIRNHLISSGACRIDDLASIPDDVLVGMSSAAESGPASCEITALTVPTSANNHRGVSMYTLSDVSDSTAFNSRATSLVVACGGAPDARIHGDAFVSRYHDDENADIWVRVDISVDECNTSGGNAGTGAEWIMMARKKGGGGGTGTTRGTSGTMSNMLLGNKGGGNLMPQVEDGRELTAIASDGSTYFWSQSSAKESNENDDATVEIKIPTLPKGTKSKYVKVNFGKKSIKVTIAGQTLLVGSLGGEVVVDDCTYTIQDSTDSLQTKELCITLNKRRGCSGSWNFAVECDSSH